MAIKQYHHNLYYSPSQKKIIKYLKPLTGIEWDCDSKGFRKDFKGLNTRRNEIKERIKLQLQKLQGNECAFCGLNLRTRVSQIEHIAPKGKKLHPEFTFEKKNLILACSLCNGFSKKASFNTISIKNINYNLCEFNIVHPYFDNPDDHFEYVKGVNDLAYLIQIKKINGIPSQKGTKSNELFELDSPAMTEERYKDALALMFPLDNVNETLLRSALSNKYSN